VTLAGRKVEGWAPRDEVELCQMVPVQTSLSWGSGGALTASEVVLLKSGGGPVELRVPGVLRALGWLRRQMRDREGAAADYRAQYAFCLSQLRDRKAEADFGAALARLAKYEVVAVGMGDSKPDEVMTSYLASRAAWLRQRAGQKPLDDDLKRLPDVSNVSWAADAVWTAEQLAAADGLARLGRLPPDRLATLVQARVGALPPPARWRSAEHYPWARARLMEVRGRLEEAYLARKPIAPQDLAPLLGVLDGFSVRAEMGLLGQDRLTQFVLAELDFLLAEQLTTPVALTFRPQPTEGRLADRAPGSLEVAGAWNDLLNALAEDHPRLAAWSHDPRGRTLTWDRARSHSAARLLP
jgi:hypothetical protein